MEGRMLTLIFITVFGFQILCNGEQVESDSKEVTTQDTSVSGEETTGKELLTAKKVSNVQEKVAAQWPLGVIHYYFDTKSYDHMIGARFREALTDVETASCVRFKALLVKPTKSDTWIHVTNPNNDRACSHEPEYKLSGEIVITLGLDCLKRRDVLHTLLHAIGFYDEVSHPARDQYIRILWNNIQPEYRRLYRIETDAATLTEYDPVSIMQFHDRAYTINGQATIAPLMSGLVISPSNQLSPLDKMKLRLLFGRECNKRKVGDLLDTCKMVLHKKFSGNESKVKADDVEVLEEDASGKQLIEGEDRLELKETEVSNKDTEEDSHQSKDPQLGVALGVPNTLAENEKSTSGDQDTHSDVVEILE